MNKGLIALSLGALSFGMGEFVVMGLLPYIAEAFSVDIPSAGYAISAYATGVCIGVIYMLFTRKLNLKLSLMLIVAFNLIGAGLCAIAPNFPFLIMARVISGFPHGCYFGLGAIIAMRICKPGQGAFAMGVIIAGLAAANLVGVPLGTFLAHLISWRAIFYIMTAWGLMVLCLVMLWLPDVGKMEDHGFKQQFNFLKSKAPYLVALSIVLANGGIFTIQSYVSPILTDFVGVPLVYVPTILIIMGVVMTGYNLISGRLSDIFTPGKVAFYLCISTITAMLLTFFWGNITFLGTLLMIYATGTLFAMSGPQQVSILRTAPGGELIGVAFGQVAFNFGNAMGAYFGGVPMEFGYGADSVLLVATGLALCGLVFMGLYIKFYEPACTARYLKEQEERYAKAQAAAKAELTKEQVTLE